MDIHDAELLHLYVALLDEVDELVRVRARARRVQGFAARVQKDRGGIAEDNFVREPNLNFEAVARTVRSWCATHAIISAKRYLCYTCRARLRRSHGREISSIRLFESILHTPKMQGVPVISIRGCSQV